MSDDLIRRSDAIDTIENITWYHQNRNKDMVKGANSNEDQAWYKADDIYDALEAIPSADRPKVEIYGNEHNCMMTMFGECSYSETGCGDCAVVEKVRKALSADRPQGEWEEKTKFHIADDDPIIEEWQCARCSVCGKYHTTPYLYYFDNFNFCPNCGARMFDKDINVPNKKGASDEWP